ncbi:MAG: VapC toxin family PIN domain ribonuclease [Opitutus sp.]|nr:VapC toxin family PIN domain ribonuclease [Opitutus sp.]
MRLLLDINTCVDALKGHPLVIAQMAAVSPADCAMSAVTAFELLNGVARSAQPEREGKKVDKFLSVVAVLPWDRAAALQAAQVRFQLERTGQKIGPCDLLIAGQALAERATLVTNKTREFARVEGLALQDWRTRRSE